MNCRGLLLVYEARDVRGKIVCTWSAILHERFKGHRLNDKTKSPFLIDTQRPGDHVSRIRFGFKVTRTIS